MEDEKKLCPTCGSETELDITNGIFYCKNRFCMNAYFGCGSEDKVN